MILGDKPLIFEVVLLHQANASIASMNSICKGQEDKTTAKQGLELLDFVGGHQI
jgi:hypothetical protein